MISRISSLVGINKNKIHGRKTKVREISKKEAADFIEANHLMGFGGGKSFLGLHSQDQLVAVAVFSKIRYMKYENPPYYSVELERFCSLECTTVIGGLDKLIKAYIKENSTDDIITYVDKEWSSGDAYYKLGFKFVDETPALAFSINETNFKRTLITTDQLEKGGYHLVKNQGNLKLRLVIKSQKPIK